MAACGGSEYYCPRGSSEPTDVPSGYYSTGSGLASYTDDVYTDESDSNYMTSILVCPKGYYCVSGVKYDCPGGQ